MELSKKLDYDEAEAVVRNRIDLTIEALQIAKSEHLMDAAPRLREVHRVVGRIVDIASGWGS